MGNIVTCIKRIYNIQMQNGIEMEVESEKPLSGVTTARLLEDDSDISTFLENVKILDIKVPQEKIVHKKQSYKKKPGKKLKKIAKLHDGLDIAHGGQDTTPGETDAQPKNMSTPCQRINMMITMEGELTRLDYQKFMDDKGHKMSDFMGYTDIENAVMLKRIAPTGERIGKGRKKYRVIDMMPVEEYMFRKILKNHKEKKRY
jgi:hypothetical protein